MPKTTKNSKRSPKSDDGSSSGSDSESEEGEMVMDQRQYKKFLNSLFPSKYLKNKIEKEEADEDTSGSSKKKRKPKMQTSRKQEASPKKSSTSSKKNKSKEEHVDIIFTIVPPKKGSGEDDEDFAEFFEDADEETDSSYSDDSEEEEDEDSDSEEESEEESDDEEEEEDEEEDVDEQSEEEESEEEEEEDEEDSEEEEQEPRKKKKYRNSSSSKKKKDDIETSSVEEESVTDTQQESREDLSNKIETFRKELKSTYRNDKSIMKTFKDFETKLNKQKSKLEKSRKGKNLKRYIELMSNKNLVSDVRFFKNTMNPTEQEKVLEELERIKSMTKIDKPYNIQLLENKSIPDKFKSIALKKINAMKVIAEGGGEYGKLKNWIDTFMRIPFDIYSKLPVSKHDETEKVQDFMQESMDTLNKAVYGMNDAKTQLMQMVAQWVANPDAVGNAIAIKGPMGTGKTTLVKHGVSKLLNREFAFIPLGGATDSSYLEGHSYTYEGSTYGKIVDILIQCKTSNPVIYFDELDKVSDTPKGEEIIGILTHLTDSTQNDKFHDKYFSEIDFDMSKCLFIFSYNNEAKINPILRDRMYNIETKGYDVKEKTIICKEYLIPKLEKELDMEKGDIIFNDEILKFIIEKYTEGEKGVRNLKRCLEIIYSKLNLYKFMKPGTQLFGNKIVENVTFPYQLNEEVIQQVLTKKTDEGNGALSMYL